MSGMIWLPVRILLLILQSAWLALGQIWSNKTRSALTTIGIIIGVASVTAVIAALSGLKASVLTEFESIGTTTIFAAPDLPREGKFRNLPWHKIQFQRKDLENMLENCPSLEIYTPATWNQATVRFGEETVDTMLIRGINSSWHKIENRSVIDGRPFSIIDEEQGWQVCLITEEVKRNCGWTRTASGRKSR
jgi:putative ABC transport system permease protein